MGASEESGLSWARGVPAPKDADGNVVPLDVRELYTGGGEKVFVTTIEYYQESRTWVVFGHSEASRENLSLSLSSLHLYVPDSWERLEEDAAKTSCGYFGRSGLCVGCPALAISQMCNVAKSQDIVRRAKALSGLH